MKQFFAFLVLVFFGAFSSVNAQAAQDKFHVDAGNGYIELPVNAQINGTYSKGDDFAFMVSEHGPGIPYYTYIVDWKGHVLWTSKSHTPIAQGAELEKKGWVKLDLNSNMPLSFQDNETVQFIPRLNERDTLYTNILDTCLYDFDMYIEAGSGLGTKKKGTFIRLLDHPEAQHTPSHCLTDNPALGHITTRLAQMSPSGMAFLYKVAPDRMLLVDHSVAVFLKPNLDFYADHPTDYHYIAVDEAYAVEKKAVLSVFKGDAEATFKNESRDVNGYSVFYESPDMLPVTEQMLVNSLDQIFKRQKADGN